MLELGPVGEGLLPDFGLDGPAAIDCRRVFLVLLFLLGLAFFVLLVGEDELSKCQNGGLGYDEGFGNDRARGKGGKEGEKEGRRMMGK